jgi:hypothetical protein
MDERNILRPSGLEALAKSEHKVPVWLDEVRRQRAEREEQEALAKSQPGARWVKLPNGEIRQKGTPGASAVTRRLDASTRVDRAPVTRSAAPEQPHFDVAMEPGKIVGVKVGDTEHWGKITDWNEETGGVRVATRAGVVNARRHHLREVTEDELRQHREREDADQEQRGARLSRFSTEDIVPGSHRVTCVDPDTDEQTEGKCVSVSHTYPQHVVLHRWNPDGSTALSVHPLHHIVNIEEPEQG